MNLIKYSIASLIFLLTTNIYSQSRAMVFGWILYDYGFGRKQKINWEKIDKNK